MSLLAPRQLDIELTQFFVIAIRMATGRVIDTIDSISEMNFFG